VPEGDTVVHSIVVVPPFTDTRGSVPPDEEDVELGKPLFVKVEVDDKAEAIPVELLRTTLTVGKSSDRISDGPRSREGRRKMGEGVDVFAQDLRGCLPVVEGKSESNLLLESDVADKNGPVESGRPGLGERQSLDVDVGIGVREVRELRGVIGINSGEQTVNGEGGWTGRVWERVSGRFCLGFGFSLFTSRPRDIGGLAGPVIDADGFKTIVGLCEVDVFEKVGGSGSRLGTDVSDLGDVGRGGRRLQGRLERFAVGKDNWRGRVPGDLGPQPKWRVLWLSGRERRKQ
jgi:hypothetical protein